MNGTRTCALEECEKPHDSHGYCGMHAARWRRGKPLDRGRIPREECFERRVDRTRGCWIWRGKVARNGYGHFSADSLLAHRYAYELWVGPIPPGMQIDHLCMVKACVNPAHLEAVTPAQNSRRADAAYAVGSAVTHCPQGHPYDAANTYHHPSGRRQCRACSRDRARRNRKKEA